MVSYGTESRTQGSSASLCAPEIRCWLKILIYMVLEFLLEHGLEKLIDNYKAC